MKELFIENLHYSIDKIDHICKPYLSETNQFILLLTNDGEYKLSKKSLNQNKFEKIHKTYISNYVTTISGKNIHINELNVKYICTSCLPKIHKEFVITRSIYKLYLNTKIHLVVETVHPLSDIYDDYDVNLLNQKRCFFILIDNADEKNKIVEKELVQWFNILN